MKTNKHLLLLPATPLLVPLGIIALPLVLLGTGLGIALLLLWIGLKNILWVPRFFIAILLIPGAFAISFLNIVLKECDQKRFIGLEDSYDTFIVSVFPPLYSRPELYDENRHKYKRQNLIAYKGRDFLNKSLQSEIEWR